MNIHSSKKRNSVHKGQPLRKVHRSSCVKRCVTNPETGKREWVEIGDLESGKWESQFSVRSKHLRFKAWSLPDRDHMPESLKKAVTAWTPDGVPCFEGRRAVREFVARSEGLYDYDD